MVRNGYDEVSGIVIGGDSVRWTLYYEGRQQGGSHYSDSYDEAKEQAEQLVKEYREEYKNIGLFVNDAWEMRTYN